MQISPHASEWLRVLRAETSVAHRSLESHPILSPLSEGEFYMLGYVRALRALAAPQIAMESSTTKYSQRNDALAEYQPLNRAPWILQDLNELDAEPFELVKEWPACDTPAAYVGALYVLEGSRFGAQVITRRLDKCIPDIPARNFFSLTKPPQWPTFVESASVYESNIDLVAEAANRVFDALRLHLDSALWR